MVSPLIRDHISPVSLERATISFNRLVWSGVVSWVLYKIVDMVFGLRVDSDSERQGLDQVSHGEAAYHG